MSQWAKEKVGPSSPGHCYTCHPSREKGSSAGTMDAISAGGPSRPKDPLQWGARGEPAPTRGGCRGPALPLPSYGPVSPPTPFPLPPWALPHRVQAPRLPAQPFPTDHPTLGSGGHRPSQSPKVATVYAPDPARPHNQLKQRRLRRMRS